MAKIDLQSGKNRISSRHTPDSDLQLRESPLTTTSAAEDANAAQDLGLFIIWEKARSQQDRILSDLERRFELLRVYEIHWTRALVAENFQRFYSDINLRGVYHALAKGAGPFLLITLIDPQPAFELRETTRGKRTINSRFLDAKMQYRAWTGEFQVHSSETPWETIKDLGNTLGVDTQAYLEAVQTPWSHTVEKLNLDIAGARGWGSMSELFGVLNRSVTYAALHYEAPLPNTRQDDGSQDIDLITDNYRAIHALLNTGQPPNTVSNGGSFPITVNGTKFRIGIRFVGDRYFDPQWQKDILASRVLDSRGFYRPSDRHCFETLAYHALVHKPAPTSEDKQRLAISAEKLGINGWTQDALNEPRRMKTLLDGLLQDRGYSYVKPIDNTVFYNLASIERDQPLLRLLTTALRRRSAILSRRATIPILAAYWHTRDRLLLHVPWLRSVKQAFHRPT